jgi:hypothetical protein
MGAKPSEAALSKVATAIHCAESDVAQPSRARSASFASAVADLKIGGEPASKTMRLDPNMTVADLAAARPTLAEKLRNTAQSSVSQAKRRVPGAEFSIEICDLTCKSGMYLIALVSRTA